jgi:hypothetical protein
MYQSRDVGGNSKSRVVSLVGGIDSDANSPVLVECVALEERKEEWYRLMPPLRRFRYYIPGPIPAYGTVRSQT